MLHDVHHRWFLQGNCSEAGPAPAGFGLTEPLPLGACAIYVEQEFMDTIQEVTLWMSNLYLVLAPTVGAKPSGLILHVRLLSLDLCLDLQPLIAGFYPGL